MRTETASRILHTAQTIVREHEDGAPIEPFLLDWAQAVCRNMQAVLDASDPPGIDIDAVHRNPRWQ